MVDNVIMQTYVIRVGFVRYRIYITAFTKKRYRI